MILLHYLIVQSWKQRLWVLKDLTPGHWANGRTTVTPRPAWLPNAFLAFILWTPLLWPFFLNDLSFDLLTCLSPHFHEEVSSPNLVPILLHVPAMYPCHAFLWPLQMCVFTTQLASPPWPAFVHSPDLHTSVKVPTVLWAWSPEIQNYLLLLTPHVPWLPKNNSPLAC